MISLYNDVSTRKLNVVHLNFCEKKNGKKLSKSNLLLESQNFD